MRVREFNAVALGRADRCPDHNATKGGREDIGEMWLGIELRRVFDSL